MTSRIATQPQAAKIDPNSVLKSIELARVREWTETDVVENFLVPLGFGYCADAFKQQHVTGSALVGVTEEHLKELNVMLLGDRILFLDYLSILKKKKRQEERAKSLWKGTTPHVSCAYSSNPCQCLFRFCCPCCVAKTSWSVSVQGLRHSAYPASINIFGKTQRDFVDFRFLKDLEIHTTPTCLCCCRGHELLVYADDPSEGGAKHDEPTRICHPDAIVLERTIRDAWAEARLVD